MGSIALKRPTVTDLLARLKRRGSAWAGQVTKKANQKLGDYGSLILVKSTSNVKGNVVEIVSNAIPKNPEKPVARAYEYGSGTHSRSKRKSRWQQGERGKILITPKNKPVLAFYWEKIKDPPGTHYINSKKLIKVSDHPDHRGKILMRYVEHPGVRAANLGKGYLAPAISEARKQMPKELREDMGDAYRAVFRRVFKK